MVLFGPESLYLDKPKLCCKRHDTSVVASSYATRGIVILGIAILGIIILGIVNGCSIVIRIFDDAFHHCF